LKYKYIDSKPMSADIEGIPFRLLFEKQNIFCIQPKWTGSPVGSLVVQGTLDEEEPYEWADLPEGTANINGANSTMFNYSQVGWLVIRVLYTRTSGSGTLDVKIKIW
jgi:hypothetical protein